MEILICLMIIFGQQIAINAVPLKIINNDVGLSEMNDDDLQIIDDDDDDDFTTHGLERLSSAATCLVAGVEYTHGQQIYRVDPCEFCLCLDGEMFCWWQDCPPALEGPCKDRGPFTPCQNPPIATQSTQITTIKMEYSSPSSPSLSSSIESIIGDENFTDSSSSLSPSSSSSSTDDDIIDDIEISTDSLPSSPVSVLPTIQHCVIMGRKYQIGDKLPHNTGNCVECICGNGAKVTCSPHQCTPIDGDINDYHPPGQRQQTPDVF